MAFFKKIEFWSILIFSKKIKFWIILNFSKKSFFEKIWFRSRGGFFFNRSPRLLGVQSSNLSWNQISENILCFFRFHAWNKKMERKIEKIRMPFDSCAATFRELTSSEFGCNRIWGPLQKKCCNCTFLNKSRGNFCTVDPEVLKPDFWGFWKQTFQKKKFQIFLSARKKF